MEKRNVNTTLRQNDILLSYFLPEMGDYKVESEDLLPRRLRTGRTR